MQRLALIFGLIGATVTMGVSSETAFDRSNNNEPDKVISKKSGEHVKIGEYSYDGGYTYDKKYQEEWDNFWEANPNAGK